jgi:guanylate kinase
LQESDVQRIYDFDHPPLSIVISGTSGSGKDSVVKELAKRIPFHFVVTANTRPRRENEVDGVDYIFVSTAEFERMIAQDELIEYTKVYGQYKGVPKQQIREAIKSNQDVLMRLDVQGAATIRRMMPEAVLIFLTAPSEQELIKRLKERHTEAAEQLSTRLQTAREEMRHIPEFDYVVPNATDQLDKTVDTIVAIIAAEKHRAIPRRAKL